MSANLRERLHHLLVLPNDYDLQTVFDRANDLGGSVVLVGIVEGGEGTKPHTDVVWRKNSTPFEDRKYVHHMAVLPQGDEGCSFITGSYDLTYEGAAAIFQTRQQSLLRRLTVPTGGNNQ